MADWTPQSRAEEILFKTINGDPYDGLPQSRIEELLLELKAVIESGGGGGGGTDNYNLLKNLPQINGKTIKGNMSGTSLGLVNMVMGKDLSTNDYTNTDKAIVDSVTTDLADKVDKITGKGLSTNDYTDADKAIVDSVTSALADKVDKVTGKGLSTNDYDDTAKGIVDGVTSALAGKVNTSSVGSANGVAELDANGRVPSEQLPSYVDDVLEYADLAHFPATGETGKIYVAEDTNKTYRWSGSDYVEISESLALGETNSTAYAGNKGKANADAIAAIKDGTNIDSFADVESAISAVNEKADTFGNYIITDATDIKDFLKKVITQADADLASKPAYKIYHIFSTYQGLDNFYGTIERQDTHGYSFALNEASGNVAYRGYCDMSTNYLNVYRYTSIPIGQATLGTGFIAAFHDGSSYRCFVPFPFWASDTNYTVALNGVSQVNVGNVLASASVETKYRTGFVLIVSGAYDYSKCGIAVNYTVTLN